mgnify:CR=1 FL=1
MIKRIFDFFLSLLLLLFFSGLIILLILMATIDLKSFGLFFQKRIGQYGKPFTIYKIKTMNKFGKTTSFSKICRKYKLDELPQLINILIGNMSFVGPRPDVEGYYDVLQGDAKKILLLKPGITSEAAIKYADEEKTLNKQADPKKYNDFTIFPDKVKLNLDYYYNHTFFVDLFIIWKTLKHYL